MEFPERPQNCPVCGLTMGEFAFVAGTAGAPYLEWEWLCGRKDCPGSDMGYPGDELRVLLHETDPAGEV